MESFEWVDAKSVDEAAALLSASARGRPVVAKAGGMDLVDLMKEGIVRPGRVVNLKSIPGLDRIEFRPGRGLTIGAMATLARIETATDMRDRYPALAAAAAHAATPQVRNAATIGGNLLQRPRCWYFRNASFHAEWSGRSAHLADAEHQYHAIFDNSRVAMVHASTPATALVAYGAEVELTGRDGPRVLAVKDLLRAPDMARDRDAAIEPGEVLTSVVVPPPAPGTRAAYHKQTERDSYDWPICDVAVVMRMERDRIAAASIVMGWVAPTPRRAVESERLLTGRLLSEGVAREAAAAAVADATPLPRNQYKVPILEAVVRRTILAAGGK